MIDLRDQKQKRSRNELQRHLTTFQLQPKFSFGVWYFFPGGGRFHEAYIETGTTRDVLETIYEMYDEKIIDKSLGLEAHYPNEINNSSIDEYKNLEKETGIRVITVIPNLFYEKQFEFGSLSNPNDNVREKAIQRTIDSLKLNKEMKTEFQVIWPGIDGYENPIGVNFYDMWDRFESGLAQAMDTAPGVRVAIEPKPYEPRGNNIYRNTANGILLARNVEHLLKSKVNQDVLKKGHVLVGLNPEVGHVLMGHEELAYSFASILREGRLVHTHWNSQPLGNYDQDQNVGVIGIDQMYAALIVLKMYGYQGRFGIDINPERMSAKKALILNMNALMAACERINNLDYDRLINAMYEPDKNRGVIEDIMIRSLAPVKSKLLPFQ